MAVWAELPQPRRRHQLRSAQCPCTRAAVADLVRNDLRRSEGGGPSFGTWAVFSLWTGQLSANGIGAFRTIPAGVPAAASGWTTGTLAGNGQIVADGGEGELFGGGGGGGGRIALYPA